MTTHNTQHTKQKTKNKKQNKTNTCTHHLRSTFSSHPGNSISFTHLPLEQHPPPHTHSPSLVLLYQATRSKTKQKTFLKNKTLRPLCSTNTHTPPTHSNSIRFFHPNPPHFFSPPQSLHFIYFSSLF